MGDTNRIRVIIFSALFSALSIILYFVPPYATPWGMNIDLIAVPWIIISLLFGLTAGLLTSGVASIFIALVGGGGWVGALAKLVATLPIIIAIGLKKPLNLNSNKLMVVILVAILLRSVLMLVLNYFFFIPLFWAPEQSLEAIMAFVPWWAIVGLNIVQSAIEIILAYALVFKTNLQKNIL